MNPPWLQIALEELGTCEIPGVANNPRIVEYHSITIGGASPDEVPWCSSFACWCMERAHIQSPRSKRAVDWLVWGTQCEIRRGAVAIFERVGGHHAAFVLDWDSSLLYILGGNQSDHVCIQSRPRNSVIAYKWPKE
jgi:uncharacterized protein (TIGR02594 family)